MTNTALEAGLERRRTSTDSSSAPRTLDLVVIGGGVAGLSAALRAAGDGVGTLLIERGELGGQVGRLARIEPVPGFPVGIGGADFILRAIDQAERFGARIRCGSEAIAIERAGDVWNVVLSDSSVVHARSVVIATGAETVDAGIVGALEFLGSGVYYALPDPPAGSLAGQEVFLVGEPAAMASAALRLREMCRTVVLVSRDARVSDRMPVHTVQALVAAGNVVLRPESEILALAGVEQLETVVIRHVRTGRTTVRAAAALFLLHHTLGRTAWLGGVLARDADGHILTGEASLDHAREAAPSCWSASRQPLESSRPGIFAAGGVRHGAARSIAAAIDDGITAARQAAAYVRQHATAQLPVDIPHTTAGLLRPAIETE
jgi:thioredoxin reductase (NADPH)